MLRNGGGRCSGTVSRERAANLPPLAMKNHSGSIRRGGSSPRSGGVSVPSPLVGSEASEARSRGQGGGSKAGPRVAAHQKSTNRISTKCTDRSRCPIARAAHFPKNRLASKARSSNPTTRASPARSSAPPRARPAARRGIAAGGRRGKFSSLHTVDTKARTHKSGAPVDIDMPPIAPNSSATTGRPLRPQDLAITTSRYSPGTIRLSLRPQFHFSSRSRMSASSAAAFSASSAANARFVGP